MQILSVKPTSLWDLLGGLVHTFAISQYSEIAHRNRTQTGDRATINGDPFLFIYYAVVFEWFSVDATVT